MARNRDLLCERRDKPILVDTVDEMVWHINGAPRGDSERSEIEASERKRPC